jgi:hypothetical protein
MLILGIILLVVGFVHHPTVGVGRWRTHPHRPAPVGSGCTRPRLRTLLLTPLC